MSDLFTKVRDQDPQIANRWKSRVARKLAKPLLTVDDIDYILTDLVRQARRSDITMKQGEALILITNASIDADPVKSGPGISRLIHYVNIWEKANRLNMTPMVTDEELLGIADFLRGGVASRIRFKSPGTAITYAPYDYIAVGQLVLNKEVLVAVSKTSGLSEYATTEGSYSSEFNIMRVNSATPAALKLTVIHEATHVIQDWQDVSHQAKYHEADAFIAESLARTDMSDPPEGALKSAAAAAAAMVVAKTATDDNKAWRKAYDDVVKQVVRTYKNDGVRYNKKRGEGEDENAKFKQILKGITILNEVRDAANKEIARLLLSVLP